MQGGLKWLVVYSGMSQNGVLCHSESDTLVIVTNIIPIPDISFMSTTEIGIYRTNFINFARYEENTLVFY